MKRLVCLLVGHAPAAHANQVWDAVWKRWVDIARYPAVNVVICTRCHANLNGWSLTFR